MSRDLLQRRQVARLTVEARPNCCPGKVFIAEVKGKDPSFHYRGCELPRRTDGWTGDLVYTDDKLTDADIWHQEKRRSRAWRYSEAIPGSERVV